MAYDAVLVPDCITLRGTTVERLEAFAAAGGRLVFAGQAPAYVDALPSDRVRALAAAAQTVPYNRAAILKALEPVREVEVVALKTGLRAAELVHQLRQDGEGRWLFLCHGTQPANPDIPKAEEIAIRLNGTWTAVLYDAMTGERHEIPAQHAAGKTVIYRTFWPHDSVLLRLEPCAAEAAQPAELRLAVRTAPARTVEENGAALNRETPAQYRPVALPLECPVTLGEPNVLVLDWAAFAVDGGALEPEEEILRIDALLRRRFGWEQRDGMLCQPYAVQAEKRVEHEVTFRFRITSGAEVKSAKLALERAADCAIRLNGAQVAPISDGWYVDEDIQTVPLPALTAGENVLEVTVPIGRRVGAEACYLLGDFSVSARGAKTALGLPVRSLCFGDYTAQGLPFYGGNVTYRLEIETGGDFLVTASNFRAPLLRVDVDGKRAGVIAWAPYTLQVSALPGKHTVELTAFGNRYNTFGAIHNADQQFFFPGNPSSWRTQGSAWSREYRLKPAGILVSPVIEAKLQLDTEPLS